MSEPLAHSGGYLLVDHLNPIADLAAGFATRFDSGGVSARWCTCRKAQFSLRSTSQVANAYLLTTLE